LPSAHSSSATSPVHISRDTSPFTDLPHPDALELEDYKKHQGQEDDDDDFAWDDNYDEDDTAMPSDLRHSDSRSHNAPLLSPENKHRDYASPPGSAALRERRSRLRERDPDVSAANATKQKYTYAAAFLVLSLISFTIQTETAVYIQHSLHWNKAYCMLYLTHGSWILLWPTQLAILRLQKLNMPWESFWRRHKAILRSTAQMVEHQRLDIPHHMQKQSPVPYFIKMTSFVTCALTVAGGSWYVAVDLTAASDLTAIYNCSAFFAYAFA
ncbi:hypothetical protein KCU66_g23540, partial [Aureobasidium melanogenum]